MKIAVMGSASSSVGRAPFKDSNYHQWTAGKVEYMQQAHDAVPGDWQIWGCSPGCWAVVPRANWWFEVHRWEAGVPWYSPEYVEFLRRFKGPVLTGGVVPEITNHVVYPIDYIEEKFSSYFLTSSLALMMAMAIDHIEQIRAARRNHHAYKSALDAGVPASGGEIALPTGVDQAELEKDNSDDVIGLWGVDMAAADEYAYQRPGCQFFVLEAMRRGIGVYLPPESDLMRPQPVYGISEWDHNYIKLTSRAREINAALANHTATIENARMQSASLQGENHALQAFVATWTSPYGMLPGMVIRQAPGTGLGSGITHFDGRPVSRMTVAPSVMQAMTESPDAQLGKALTVELVKYCGETGLMHPGTSEGAVETLQRIAGESRTARALSAIVQPYVRAGETTPDALIRMLMPKMKAKKRRR
jgi:hypothetical protein